MKKAHFTGICGAGMSAVAMLLKQEGWEITGSDVGCHPPVSDYLKQQKIPVSLKYNSSSITNDIDLVVAGGNAKLKPGENEELNSAREMNIPVKTFPEVLGEVGQNKQNILAVGSYGKSTCATLLAWCLHHAGKDPSYFIGALPLQMDVPAHVGTSDIFILEGDEYPTSSIDPRSKFLHINTHDVLLVSGEHDHVNIFPTLEAYLEPFTQLLQNVPGGGKIIACIDNPHVDTLIAPHNDKTITYGLDENKSPMWSAKNILPGQKTTFDLTHNGEVAVNITTQLLGHHNIQNIVGISALLLEKRLLTPKELSDALADFKGVTRRLDLKTEESSVLMYEGFGSSHDKARAAIDAMRLHFPEKRLAILFEPHTFSWRNRNMLHWYDDVFDDCDEVFMYKPPEVAGANAHEGEEKHVNEQLTQEEIVAQVEKSGTSVTPFSSSEDALEKLHNFLKPDDLLLVLTSGHLDGLLAQLPEKLEEWFPKEL